MIPLGKCQKILQTWAPDAVVNGVKLTPNKWAKINGVCRGGYFTLLRTGSRGAHRVVGWEGPILSALWEWWKPQVDLHDLFQADDEALERSYAGWNVCCCSLQLLGESCSPWKNGAWEKRSFPFGKAYFQWVFAVSSGQATFFFWRGVGR